MPILSPEATQAFLSLGHVIRRDRVKLSTATQLMMGTNVKLPPLKVKVKVGLPTIPKPLTRQQRRQLDRAASK